MIKLIVSDLDGTLLNKKGVVPPDFFEVLPELERMDVRFVVATGRQVQSARDLFGSFADRLLFISQNGAVIHWGDGRVFRKPIEKELILHFLDESRKIPGVHPMVFAENDGFSWDWNEELEEIFRHYNVYCSHKPDLRSFIMEEEIIRLTICDMISTSKNSYPVLKPIFSGLGELNMASERWLDLAGPGTNKGTALEKVQAELGILPAETMVFGDYDNDLDMLTRGHYSFAMGNACQKVKDTARFQCGTNEENGELEAIRRCVLNKRLKMPSYSPIT